MVQYPVQIVGRFSVQFNNLRALTSEVGYIARRKGLKGRVVMLKIRLKGFKTHTRQRTIFLSHHKQHVGSYPTRQGLSISLLTTSLADRSLYKKGDLCPCPGYLPANIPTIVIMVILLISKAAKINLEASLASQP